MASYAVKGSDRIRWRSVTVSLQCLKLARMMSVIVHDMKSGIKGRKECITSMRTEESGLNTQREERQL